jgi:type II secretion system protein N
MPPTKSRRALKVAGYVAFVLLSLTLSFFLTFPYEALKDRIRLEADTAGYFVRIASVGPGFFSLKLKGIEIAKKAETTPPPESLMIDSASIGPSLFPPGLKVHLDAFGGDVVVRASGISNVRIKGELDDVDVSKGNLKGFSGIDFGGTVAMNFDVTIPRVAAAPGTPLEPDLSAAFGNVSLNSSGLTIKGGTVSVAIAQYGSDPTPLDLPKIGIGELVGKIKIEKGLVTLDELKSKSADFESKLLGTIKLAKRLEYSELNVDVKLKLEPEFQKGLGMLSLGLSVMGPDAQDATWRAAKLTGSVGRPQFR